MFGELKVQLRNESYFLELSEVVGVLRPVRRTNISPVKNGLKGNIMENVSAERLCWVAMQWKTRVLEGFGQRN